MPQNVALFRVYKPNSVGETIHLYTISFRFLLWDANFYRCFLCLFDVVMQQVKQKDPRGLSVSFLHNANRCVNLFELRAERWNRVEEMIRGRDKPGVITNVHLLPVLVEPGIGMNIV